MIEIKLEEFLKECEREGGNARKAARIIWAYQWGLKISAENVNSTVIKELKLDDRETIKEELNTIRNK